MFWKIKDQPVRRMSDPADESALEQLEQRLNALEKRVLFIERPEEAEKERILDLQERVAKGYKKRHGIFVDFYTEEQLKRYSQEIADYYTKKVKEASKCSGSKKNV